MKVLHVIKYTNNLIKKRLDLSLFKKFSKLNKTASIDFLSDLKSIKQFEKYFITESQMKEKVEKLKKEHKKVMPEDLCWYKQTEDVEYFYVYQLPPIGVSLPLYGVCYITEFMRRGYDDQTCLAAVYKVDDNGNESSIMIGYKKIDDSDIIEGKETIREYGIKGYGITYVGGDAIYDDFLSLKDYVQNEINKRDDDLIT